MNNERAKNEALRAQVRAYYKVIRKMAESTLTAETPKQAMEVDENLRSLIFSLKKPWNFYICIAFFLLAVYLPDEGKLNEDAIIERLARITRRITNDY